NCPAHDVRMLPSPSTHLFRLPKTRKVLKRRAQPRLVVLWANPVGYILGPYSHERPRSLGLKGPGHTHDAGERGVVAFERDFLLDGSPIFEPCQAHFHFIGVV